MEKNKANITEFIISNAQMITMGLVIFSLVIFCMRFFL